MQTVEVLHLGHNHLGSSYQPAIDVLTRGEGCYLWSLDEKRYLDLSGGLGALGLGHCHPKIVEALSSQIRTLSHTPLHFYSDYPIQLAKRFSEISMANRTIFFDNTHGALEAAIHLIHRYHSGKNRKDKIRILTATEPGSEPHFAEPSSTKFKHIPLEDETAWKSSIEQDVAGIVMEPVGLGQGVALPPQGTIKMIREMSKKKDALLVVDEHRVGLGRCGELFFYERLELQPDMVILGDPLGSGFSFSALLLSNRISQAVDKSHVFTGVHSNPLLCKIALAAIETILRERLVLNSQVVGKFLLNQLQSNCMGCPIVDKIEGAGLLAIITLKGDSFKVVKECYAEGLILAAPTPNTIWLTPALNVQKSQVRTGVDIIKNVLGQMK